MFAHNSQEEKKDYEIKYVPLITLEGYLFTIEGGFQNEDTLILLHGFGTPSAFWVKMLPEQFKKFHVYTMDLYGMGCSFRFDKAKFKSDINCIETYTKSIEEWRQNLGLENFYLMGHSLGGYLACHYLNIYKPKVQGIFLLSPAGVVDATKQQIESELDTMRNITNPEKKFGAFQKVMFKTVMKIIAAYKVSPYSLSKIYGKRKIVHDYFRVKSFQLSDDERLTLENYFKSILNENKQCGEKCIGYFQKYSRYSENPFGDFLEDLAEKYKIVFFYGETDWMLIDRVKIRIEELKSSYGSKLEDIVIIKNAGHQLLLDNPTELTNQILNYFNKFKSN